MSNNLYIAAAEAKAGKSLIVLGFMELLSRHVKKIGFFRPVVRSAEEQDQHIRLIKERYKLQFPYSAMYGMSSKEALDLLQAGDTDAVFTGILNKYKQLEKECDFILIEGTDFRGTLSPFEFDMNARMANNLGAPILAVINGFGKTTGEISESIHIIRGTLAEEKCAQIGTIVNRVEERFFDDVSEVNRALHHA
ncbi:MAG: AAA family ATPase, partial [Bacteroidales bacterium]